MRFPPAWYPDPTGRHDHRWWDGAEWTAHVADAGRASTDPLPDAPAGVARAGTASDAGTDVPTAPATGAATGQAPRIAVAALVVGVAAGLLGWIPFLGVAVAVAAVVLALVARRRTGRRRGRGLATGGLVVAGLGLLTAVATTWVAVLILTDGSGGRIGAAARAYVECLGERPEEICERRLTADLMDALRR